MKRAALSASQVNSWTDEYLAGGKYEAQLAFKRKSSPGASGRSQPARPWSAARQEPCVKAEGLCHCVQMFPPHPLPPLRWLSQNTHNAAHTMHRPWCGRWFHTQSKHLTQTPSPNIYINTQRDYARSFISHTHSHTHTHIPSSYSVCTGTSLSCVLHSNKHLSTP